MIIGGCGYSCGYLFSVFADADVMNDADIQSTSTRGRHNADFMIIRGCGYRCGYSFSVFVDVDVRNNADICRCGYPVNLY